MTGDEAAAAFAVVLRAQGVDVPIGCTVAYAAALDVLGLSARSGCYWAGRCTLIRRPEDVPAYDRAFAAFWERVPSAPVSHLIASISPVPVVGEVDSADGHLGPEDDDDDERRPLTVTARWSPLDVLRHRDLGKVSDDERAELRRMIDMLRLRAALRPTRRAVRSRRRGRRPDLRGTVRAALRTGGEPLRRLDVEPGVRPRRVVLLLDVSGSMAPYSAALVRFVHAAVLAGERAEAFALGTRLTRITRQLSWRDPDEALARASRAVLDWSGGTRLGEGLRAFNDTWGIRGMARGAVVVILSDGWDRGDPEVLAAELARLRRVASRIVWANPLMASPGWEPRTRALSAALPYIDEMVEAHSIASLQSLAVLVGGNGRDRTSGVAR